MQTIDDAYDALARLTNARMAMVAALTEAKRVFGVAGPKWDDVWTLTDEVLADVEMDTRLQEVIDTMEELTNEDD